MIEIDELHRQINLIISKLIEFDLLLDQQYPSKTSHIITCIKGRCLTDYFKYDNKFEFYKKIIENKDYNLLLFDGSFIQFMYKYKNEGTIKFLAEHRLLFFPCPLEITENEITDNPELGLLDIIEQHDLDSFSSKLRMDGYFRFDYDIEAAQNIEHPESHVHISKSGRVPVIRPLSPFDFIRFIFRNCFKSEWDKFNLSSFFSDASAFDDSITEDEKKIMHINW